MSFHSRKNIKSLRSSLHFTPTEATVSVEISRPSHNCFQPRVKRFLSTSEGLAFNHCGVRYLGICL
ncbi:hypothetical protein EXN66_Car000351 [Channa argus]|uniref:Uncharacterized protein n=1 Tax=Channa argus TaxID=215402 RepID=A0A6G1QY88_CHAAH|nr:hypothetical protein EXN66_Car000351 [Channa argus]